MALLWIQLWKEREKDVSFHDKERDRLLIRWIYLHRHTQRHIPNYHICSSSVLWNQGHINQPNDRSGWWKSDRHRTNRIVDAMDHDVEPPSSAKGSKRLDQNQSVLCRSEKGTSFWLHSFADRWVFRPKKSNSSWRRRVRLGFLPLTYVVASAKLRSLLGLKSCVR